MNQDEEFYIGYETGMPPGARRAVRAAVVAAVVLAIGSAALLVGLQRTLAESRFEFGHVRTFSGYLSLTPAPALLVVESGVVHPHWLVSPGKRGPEAALGTASAGWVTLSGTLAAREAWRMIELVPGSVRRGDPRGAPPALPAPAPRRVTLRGEIVDSKCYLGVMNPGERTVHRDCAARCLAGGVPAMLAWHNEAGAHLALLLGADARALREGTGNTVTLSGLLSGPPEAQVFAVDLPE